MSKTKDARKFHALRGTALSVYAGHAVPIAWRVCNPHAITDGEHRYALIINSRTATAGLLDSEGKVTPCLWDAVSHLMDVGARIKVARIRHGMSQERLADALGVTKTAVAYWETALRKPSEDCRDRLGTILGIDFTEEANEEA